MGGYWRRIWGQTCRKVWGLEKCAFTFKRMWVIEWEERRVMPRRWGWKTQELTTWARWADVPVVEDQEAVVEDHPRVEDPAVVEDHPGVEDPEAQEDQEQGTADNLCRF